MCRLVRGLVGLGACECGQARRRWLIGVVRGIAWLVGHYVSKICLDIGVIGAIGHVRDLNA